VSGKIMDIIYARGESRGGGCARGAAGRAQLFHGAALLRILEEKGTLGEQFGSTGGGVSGHGYRFFFAVRRRRSFSSSAETLPALPIHQRATRAGQRGGKRRLHQRCRAERSPPRGSVAGV